MSKTNKIIYFLISIVFFIAFDLYFSELILDSLRFKIEENPILDLIFVQNTGAAFSILENSQVFLIGFSIFASGKSIKLISGKYSKKKVSSVFPFLLIWLRSKIIIILKKYSLKSIYYLTCIVNDFNIFSFFAIIF